MLKSMVYNTNVLHEPITVQGRQGMEKVDFKEKMTAARDFGHLLVHELFI